jgi:hypothetical protein
MADYVPITWKDRAVEKPRTYTIQDNGDGTVTLIPVPGTVYEGGTPVNAGNMNHIEQGIAAALPKASNGYPGAVADGTDADTYPWKVGWYQVGPHTVNMPLTGSYWFVQCLEDGAGSTVLVAYRSNTKNDYYVRMKIGTWGNWNQLITSAGEQTINGSLTVGEIKASVPPFGGVGLDFEVYGQNDITMFRSHGYSIKFDRLSGDIYTGGNKHWHAGHLRNNGGVLELNNGGTWTPVGGVKRVQRGSASIPTTGSGTIDVTIDSVVTSKSSANLNSIWFYKSSSNASSANVSAEITSATNLAITWSAGDTLGATIKWEVVESY